MTGYLRIGGALMLGMVLIFGAFVYSKSRSNAQAAGAIVGVAPERTYIETDTNNDGVEDWKEEFPNHDGTIALPAPKPVVDDPSYTEPTTFTGKFAKAIFNDYVKTKSLTGGAIDQKQFVNAALDSVESATQGRVYSRLNIITIPDSPEALHTYGNTMASILGSGEPIPENQLLILERAVKTQDKTQLEGLAPIKRTYDLILERSLAVPVPQSLASDHAEFVTMVDAIRTDIEGMQNVFTDPLYALARVKQHTDNIAGFFAIIKNVTTKLLASGVSYENDEPGALIYTIEP